MKNHLCTAALIAVGLFASSGVALAEKPDWAGGGKHGNKHERHSDDRFDDRRDGPREFRFSDDDRRIVMDYYGARAHQGHCPPGLAKKHNGCMPPGQERKWRKGRELPRDVRYYELPREVLVRLPPPPPQHRYVQIAGDVLLIAVGSSVVVDAIEDIMR